MSAKLLFIIASLFLAFQLSAGAPPVIHQLFPAAAAPGKETTLRIVGEHIDGPATMVTSFPSNGSFKRESGTVPFKINLPRDLSVGLGAVRLITTNGMSGWQLFLVDPIPSVLASATNHSVFSAQQVSKPTAIDGVCEDLRSDYFQFSAKRGERITIEVVAQRIGSSLDPWLRVLDDEGRELLGSDDTPGLGTDVRVEFKAPRKGNYTVELRDTQYSGGPQHRYRLRLAAPLPNPLPFHIHPDFGHFVTSPDGFPVVIEREPNNFSRQSQSISTPVELLGKLDPPGDKDIFEFYAKKDQRLLFTGRSRSLGSPCDLIFYIQTTNGSKMTEVNVTGADEGILTNRFATTGPCELVVEELNRLGGADFNYSLSIDSFEPGFILTTETDRISAPPGGSFEIELQVDRRDFDGPIQLALTGLGEEFAIPDAIIPSKTNSVKLKVVVPSGLELEKFYPFGIIGTATVGNVSFETKVRTLPALRLLFPAMRYPPRELDGLLMLSVSAIKVSPSSSRRRRTDQMP